MPLVKFLSLSDCIISETKHHYERYNVIYGTVI